MSSRDRDRRPGGGCPPKYLFGPDSELTESERLRKDTILRRRERQNEYYQRKKRAKKAEKEDQSGSGRIGSSSSSAGATASTTSAEIAGIPLSNGAKESTAGTLSFSESLSDLLERAEEDAVVSDILDEMGGKTPGTSEKELKYEMQAHRNHFDGTTDP